MKILKVMLMISGLMFAVSGFGQSSHSVALTWVASSDAASNPTLTYAVYRASVACPASGSPTGLTKLVAVSATTYTDTAVSVGQTYCYIVRASLNGSESVDSNTAGGTIPIAPVTGLSITVK